MKSTITKYLTSISLTFALCTNLYADDASQTSEIQENQDTQIQIDHKSDSVSNIFWQSTYATMCGMNAGRVSVDSLSDRAFNIEGGALGLCLYQKDDIEKRGFHMDGTGFYTGISAEAASRYKVGFHFVAQNTHAMANASHNEITTDYLSLGSQWQINCFQGKLILVGNYLYTLGNHQINPTDSQRVEDCCDAFESQTIGNSLSCYFPIKAKTNHRLTVTPFVCYQAFSSRLNKIQEQSTYLQTLLASDVFLDVSLPFGLHNALVFHGCCPSVWELQVAYKPTVFRTVPVVDSIVVADNSSWTSSPIDVSYHAFSINFRNNIQLLKHLHINCNYQCDISSSTCNHYLLAGGKLSF
ncbi:autotransporter outer membrane beta-barrel domain-containing protein [Chlamydia psittaci]|uniref:autotransporter outer membrane beta-barrel domain-containing protein n=1 Tax=Chlamydia psittaci TaxID=83554 RepID=UPI00027E1BAA|nr:autotransporter outer membrane beta-barrel domain-containing protein [Chlamydia psittaci]EPJ25177.1 autotransporter beta-domain protein [Chlamydia psittaci 09DC77]EPJ30290.1 autotransporter beta-domain protein [Chlamydia psittaci 09DC78]EPL01647.1 autotransporter beta-domain protein [Chlamydia psittaci 09DC79]AFS22108.1 autotransporter beta-domain protein [Chlamydia psittaci MN]AFS26718.1 autotransporter beta-domain protein [Chlamydia psittaci CP3]